MKFYEVDFKYVDYLLPFAPHLFRNKQAGQQNTRKYIGVVLEVNDMKYFAPLSSYKTKHNKMKDSLDFVKIGNYAVININNMFPVPEGCYTYVDFSKERNQQYRKLLMAEYRIVLGLQDKIKRNAKELYKQKVCVDNKTALTKRCNDFRLLEEKCKQYDLKH